MAIRRGKPVKARVIRPHADRLKDEYERLHRNACYVVDAETWEAAVEKLLRKRYGDSTPTLEQLLQAARDATVSCPDCNGSGQWQGGASVNGRMTKSGPCCCSDSKGRQGQDDFTRNWGYDNYHRKVM